ncbi:MAG: chaperone modulator CbpM [Nitrospiria bacterium]
MSKENKVVSITTPVVVDEGASFRLSEVCGHFSVQTEWIASLVEEGILDPEGSQPRQWRFSAESCRRIGMVLRLQRDLGVNLSGVALVLDLLDEVEMLRVQLETTVK